MSEKVERGNSVPMQLFARAGLTEPKDGAGRDLRNEERHWRDHPIALQTARVTDVKVRLRLQLRFETVSRPCDPCCLESRKVDYQ